MLQALTERGIRADLVVGTSIGALNGACYAESPTLDGARAARGGLVRAAAGRHLLVVGPLDRPEHPPAPRLRARQPGPARLDPAQHVGRAARGLRRPAARRRHRRRHPRAGGAVVGRHGADAPGQQRHPRRVPTHRRRRPPAHRRRLLGRRPDHPGHRPRAPRPSTCCRPPPTPASGRACSGRPSTASSANRPRPRMRWRPPASRSTGCRRRGPTPTPPASGRAAASSPSRWRWPATSSTTLDRRARRARAHRRPAHAVAGRRVRGALHR